LKNWSRHWLQEMTFNLEVYKNSSYRVELDSEPYIHQGEPMNWLVINNQYGTVEATTSALTNALLIADQFEQTLYKIVSTEDKVLN